MKNTTSLLIILLFFSLIFYSCEKEKINPSDCTAGCKTIRLSGKVLDASSNIGIANAEVRAHFYQWKSTCFICFGEPVETFAKTQTDYLGRFNVDIIVDTGVFDQMHHYSLIVYANTYENYISGNSKSFSHYNDNFSNITLTKYQKTKLSIRFKRDSIDLFDRYIAEHIFVDNLNNVNIRPPNQVNFFKHFSQIIPDTTLEVVTGANTWTKIFSKKISGSSHIISEYADSVFCNANTANNITIKY